MASAFSSPAVARGLPRASRPPPRRRLALRPARALPPPAATSPEGIPPPPTFPNPLGVHALVWTGGWSEPERRAACEGTAKTGYDLVEIPLLDPSSVDPDMTRRVLAEHDLRATTSLGLSFDADVSSPDEAIAKRGEALLDAALDVTAGMGASHMCGVLYSALGKYDAPRDPRGYDNAVRALRRVARRAADANVILGLEVVNRYETNVLNTAAQASTFVDEIGEPNVKVHLDSYHANIEEESLRRAVLTCGDRLGYVHVGESHRGALGTGTVDFVQLFGDWRRLGTRDPSRRELRRAPPARISATPCACGETCGTTRDARERREGVRPRTPGERRGGERSEHAEGWRLVLTTNERRKNGAEATNAPFRGTRRAEGRAVPRCAHLRRGNGGVVSAARDCYGGVSSRATRRRRPTRRPPRLRFRRAPPGVAVPPPC